MRHHINGYGKPLPNLISTERSCKIQYEDWPHCSAFDGENVKTCLLYTSPSPRDRQKSRMPSSA